jgi:hypothetical protein
MGTGINNPVPIDFKETTRSSFLASLAKNYANSWTSQATKGRAKRIIFETTRSARRDASLAKN